MSLVMSQIKGAEMSTEEPHRMTSGSENQTNKKFHSNILRIKLILIILECVHPNPQPPPLLDTWFSM